METKFGFKVFELSGVFHEKVLVKAQREYSKSVWIIESLSYQNSTVYTQGNTRTNYACSTSFKNMSIWA